MDKLTYVKLLRTSRGLTRRAHEAEDLLQAVLLAAVDAGRTDLSCDNNRHWVIGALRKRALFDARSAVRRRQRETSYAVMHALATPASTPSNTATPSSTEPFPADFVRTLTPALRTTALLVLTGHSRKEIAWLLRLSDPALRQRIREIRQRWRRTNGYDLAEQWGLSESRGFYEMPGLRGNLSFGRLRQTMLKAVQHRAETFASHDPDGHVLMVTSQKPQAWQLP